MRRVLICEDEEQICSFLQKELIHEGYEADCAYNGADGLAFFKAGSYDLVLLDLMLPGINGHTLLREIRAVSAVPVLVLTARREVYDKVALLDAGADDYITKPFDTPELLARIRRALKRGGESAEHDFITVDEPGCRVSVGGAALPLTLTEFKILALLYKRRGAVQTRGQILNALYGEYIGDSNSVDVNIKNIRRKIAAVCDAEVIETVRGRGYVLR
jgi:two-component system response regulator ArlR